MRSQRNRAHKQQGFTLLEVLVAIGMFAVISLAATQMLRTMINSHETTQARIDAFSGLTRTLNIMERDFSQMVPRGVKSEYAEPMPPLMVGTGPYAIELSRTGWTNPLGRQRSELQRVAYEVNGDGELIRHFWLVMDRAEDSESIKQVLLSGVKDFRINLLDKDGNTQTSWPSDETTNQLPLAAELLIETELLGEIRRVYALVATVKAAKPAADSDGGTPGSNDGLGSGSTGDSSNGSNNNQSNGSGDPDDPGS